MCRFNPKNDSRRIDPCMKHLVNWLKNADYEVVACCCGHSKYPMSVVVRFRVNGKPYYVELLSDTGIKRAKKFYKKDKQGYYFIPEVMEKER